MGICTLCAIYTMCEYYIHHCVIYTYTDILYQKKTLNASDPLLVSINQTFRKSIISSKPINLVDRST